MTILTIALVAISVWMILLIPYGIWLRKTTFFYAQRTYLLSSIIVGILAGIFKAYGLNLIGSGSRGLMNGDLLRFSPEIIFSQANKAFDTGGMVSSIVSSPLFTSIYLLVSLGLLAILIYKIIELITMVRGNSVSNIQGMTIVESPALHTPFSFFHLIFLSKERQLDDDSLRTIIKHESVHTKQLHSLDILLVEFLLTFTWFFPILLLYKKYFNTLHEYIADDIVIRDITTQQYGLLLISQRMGDGKALTHNFAKSALKDRFLKMAQTRSNKLQMIGFLSFFPLILLCGELLNKWQLSNLGKVVIHQELNEDSSTVRELYLTPGGELKVVPKVTRFGDEFTPQYPGGELALTEYVSENLRIPKHIDMKGQKIFTRLNFDEDGKIILITYFNKLTPEVEEAMNRVFRDMPLWEAPTVKGKKYRSEVVFPISFGN